ncbi:hypothetical protein EVAR_2643_1 [Eumeta japonica]|uniref:Uncharacterized protein n=1 Tax=Eumeta variegata TaxID=151549 RepID=A0A4C1SPP8_EUMVA|nr:hypothetical protein EVAR_2643_1 [Eumeta japonica]
MRRGECAAREMAPRPLRAPVLLPAGAPTGAGRDFYHGFITAAACEPSARLARRRGAGKVKVNAPRRQTCIINEKKKLLPISPMQPTVIGSAIFTNRLIKTFLLTLCEVYLRGTLQGLIDFFFKLEY